MSSITSISDIQAEALRLRNKRAKYLFTLPESLAASTGITSISVVALTANEELAATKRAGGDPVELARELSKEAVKQVDGRDLSDGEIETFWANPDNAKIRMLAMSAYNKINQPAPQETQDFLASCQVKIS